MTQEGLNKILKQHQLWLNTDGEEGKKADLSFDDLRNADLMFANLEGANLINAKLTFANLRGADLSYARLGGANLKFADLSGVNLRHVGLTGADLRFADLSGADLRGADLRGTNLTGADLTGSNINSTGVYFFDGLRHYGIYNSKDDKLYIGCQVHNLEHWLEYYVDIGRKYVYTDEEIKVYGAWIKSLKELPK